ncbi:AMP-dependent synthetase/ligase [Yinghuangia aomiensis]
MDPEGGREALSDTEAPRAPKATTTGSSPSPTSKPREPRSSARNPTSSHAASPASNADQLATIIYTSGTTGRPKGVRVLHEQLVLPGRRPGRRGLQRRQRPAVPVAAAVALLRQGHDLGPAAHRLPRTAVDGRIPKIVENLPIVRPTFMAAAPRVFEKVYNTVVTRVKAEGGAKYAIFTWAVGVGRRHVRARAAGHSPGLLLDLRYKLADKLVFAKLRELFGGRMKGCISGSAALSDDVAEFFEAIGVPVFQGYGLTEATAGNSVNRYGENRLGTVGRPLPGTEIRIADDGEVLVRGPAVMAGYHNNPEATAEVLDDDGWLHTGDIGELDAHGSLRITDRKKDLIKTSGGKYVAPSDVEGRFKSMCPYVSNVIVHGNNRNFCSALITLDADAIRGWADTSGLAGLEYADLRRAPPRSGRCSTATSPTSTPDSSAGRRSRSTRSSRATSASNTAS